MPAWSIRNGADFAWSRSGTTPLQPDHGCRTPKVSIVPSQAVVPRLPGTGAAEALSNLYVLAKPALRTGAHLASRWAHRGTHKAAMSAIRTGRLDLTDSMEA